MSNRINKHLPVTPLLWGLILLATMFACNFPQPVPLTPAPEVPSFGLDPNESAPPSSMPCGYVWAQQDLPEIGQRFNANLQKLLPDATGGAYAFGEDCIREDGTSTFSAMETDFTLDIPVKDLKDDGALGVYLEQVIPFMAVYPTEGLPAHIGRIDIRFYVTEEEFRYIRFDLTNGQAALDKGLRGAELVQELAGQY